MSDMPAINSGGSTAGVALEPFRFVSRSGLTLVYPTNKATRTVGITRRAHTSGDTAEYAYARRTRLEVLTAVAIPIDAFIMPGANGIGQLHDGVHGSIYGARALEAVAQDLTENQTVTIEVEILPGYAHVVDTDT